MGWLFCSPSKQDMVRKLKTDGYLFDPEKATILKTATVGNALWMAVKRRDTGEVFISLSLLSQHNKQWGHKDLDESVHPYYYDCPLSLLELATEPVDEQAAEWRERVRERAIRVNRARAAKRAITTGSTVQYGGEEYRLNYSLGRRGWDVTRTRDGASFRMKSTQVSKALNQAEAA